MAGAGQQDRRQKWQTNHGSHESHGRATLLFIRVIGVIRGGFFFYRELREAREFPERGRRQAGK